MKKFIGIMVAAVAVFSAAVSAQAQDLVYVQGNDVMVHDSVIREIRGGYVPGEAVYALQWNVPGPFNRDRVERNKMTKDGEYWRASGMACKRFHPAQLVPGEKNVANIRFAQIENLVSIVENTSPEKTVWLDTSEGLNKPCIKACSSAVQTSSTIPPSVR